MPSVCPGFCRGEQLVAFINPRRAPATITWLVCGEAGGALWPCPRGGRSRNRGTANHGRDEQPVASPTTGRACATWDEGIPRAVCARFSRARRHAAALAVCARGRASDPGQTEESSAKKHSHFSISRQADGPGIEVWRSGATCSTQRASQTTRACWDAMPATG